MAIARGSKREGLRLSTIGCVFNDPQEVDTRESPWRQHPEVGE